MKILPFSGKAGRIAVALTIAGAAAATAVAATPGTFGGFTASATNPGNSITAGTVKMSDDVSGALSFSNATLTAPISSTNLEPTKSVSGLVTITNSGTLPASVTLAISNVHISDPSGAAIPAGDWTVQVSDDLSNAVIANASLANISAVNLPASPPASPATTWAAGESHKYTITVSLNGGNEVQGSNVSFELDWASSQV
jgi:hypothetical protein